MKSEPICPTRAYTGIKHLTLAVLLAAPLSAVAAEQRPLSLDEAEAIALADAPEVVKQAHLAAALEESAGAAGSLPDPQLRLGLANLPTDSFALGQEAMTQVQVGLRQTFPDAGGRTAERARMLGLAEARMASASETRHRIQREVRTAWLDVYRWRETARTVAGSRSLFQQLVDATRSRYSAGARNQHDLIRAELELTRLDDRALAAHEREAAARGRLSEWLGEAADRPLPDALPDLLPDALPHALVETGETHPTVQGIRAKIQATEAGVEIAESAYRPDFAMEVGLGFRGGRDITGAERPDFVSIAVSMDLPLFAERRQDRRLAAAHLEREAAVAEHTEVLRRLRAQRREIAVRIERTRSRRQLYDDEIAPRTERQARAALDAYRADQGDFAEVMRAHVAILDVELERLELAVDLRRLQAALAYLMGEDHA